MMRHALSYAADGFAVFPVYEPERRNGGLVCSCGKPDCRGKHPRTINGVKDATTNINQIKEWWQKWPNASIGIATGKRSGLAVVDLDGQAGIASGMRLGLSSSVCALTGNGKQLFYADTEAKLKNSVKKLADGVDTRGEGGYVVAPPSLHPNGKRYSWQALPLSRKALAPLPTLFAKQENTHISTVSKPADRISESLKGMRNGNIDNTLTSILGRMRHDGWSTDDAITLLSPHADRAGATAGHLSEKVKHIWEAYPSAVQVGQTGKSEAIDTFLEDIAKVEWLCAPMVAEKSIGFLAGLPETMKTWISMDLAVECARGGSWLGLFPTRRGRVLFIDQERARPETQRRFKAILAAKGLKQADLRDSLFLKCGTTIKIDLEASYQAFRAELLELRPDIVIIDSFATFHSTPENDRMAIQNVLNRVKALRDEIGCAIWFLNHESKLVFSQIDENKAPNAYTMLGSVGIVAAAESVLVVRKIEAGLSYIHHVKSTLATSSKSFTVALQDTPDGVIIKGTL